VYNRLVNQPLLKGAYNITFSLIDKGVLEVAGPTGGGKLTYALGRQLARVQTGWAPEYAIFILGVLLLALIGADYGFLFTSLPRELNTLNVFFSMLAVLGQTTRNIKFLAIPAFKVPAPLTEIVFNTAGPALNGTKGFLPRLFLHGFAVPKIVHASAPFLLLLPEEKLTVCAMPESLTTLLLFACLSVLFSYDEVITAKVVSSTDFSGVPDGPGPVSFIPFLLGGLKKGAFSTKAAFPDSLEGAKLLFQTTPDIGKLLSSPDCTHLIDHSTIVFMFPGHPVSASSIPADITSAEHVELVAHAQTTGPSIPEAEPADLPQDLFDAPAQEQLPLVENPLPEATEPSAELLQQLSASSSPVTERVFGLPELLDPNLLPGFKLLRRQCIDITHTISFSNPVFEFHLYEELLRFYANGINLP
jgi:hypothetical protein